MTKKLHLPKLEAISGNAGLGIKQRQFVLMVSHLIAFAHAKGYGMSFGDAFRDPRLHGFAGQKQGYGAANSLHKERLAIDLNLFRGGRYLEKTEDHRELGEFWESIGGTWGGRFNDGNHYSLEHGGRK